MLKYSLGSLLIVMAGTALGCAAVANWSPLWAEIMTTATVAILLVAVLVALVGRGNARTFAIGFAAAGVAYFLLAFCAPAELRDERLATRRAVDRLYALTQKANSDATMRGVAYLELAADSGMPMGGGEMASGGLGEPGFMFGMGSGSATVTGVIVSAKAPREFEDIGHCLWALILALVGGVLAQVIQRMGRKEQTAGPRS